MSSVPASLLSEQAPLFFLPTAPCLSADAAATLERRWHMGDLFNKEVGSFHGHSNPTDRKHTSNQLLVTLRLR